MSSDEQKEIERLKRLREKQLTARDPHKETRKQMKQFSLKQKNRSKFALENLLRDIDHKWQGLIYGFLAGGLLAVLIGFLVPTTTGAWIALGALLVLPAFGFIFGASLDWRDDLKRF